MIIINSLVSVSNPPESDYTFIANETSDRHNLGYLMKSHYYNGIKFLKKVEHNSVVSNNNVIVHALYGGEYSNDRILSMPLEYVNQDIVYFKNHIIDKLSSQGVGLDFGSFTCDLYTFLKFTQLYTYMNLSNLGNWDTWWKEPEYTKQYFFDDHVNTSRLTREVCAAFDIRFYFEGLVR